MAPSYHRLGEVPRKRHVAFRTAGGDLYSEEVVGTEGFSGRYSIQYHRYAPTRVVKVAEADPLPPRPVPALDVQARHQSVQPAREPPGPLAQQFRCRPPLRMVVPRADLGDATPAMDKRAAAWTADSGSA